MVRRWLVPAVCALVTSACGVPFLSPSLPTTVDLINGAADSLASATGLEVTGTFTGGANSYAFDIQLAPPDAANFQVTTNTHFIEGRQVGSKVYYLSPDLVRASLSSDPYARQLAKGLNDRWFTSSTASPLDLGAFTKPARVKANFLNTLTLKRKDNIRSGNANTAELDR